MVKIIVHSYISEVFNDVTSNRILTLIEREDDTRS
jgi:hypothetical protein